MTAGKVPDQPPPVFPFLAVVTAIFIVILIGAAVSQLLVSMNVRTKDYWETDGRDFPLIFLKALAAVGISVLLVVIAAVRLLLRRTAALATFLGVLAVLLVTAVVLLAMTWTYSSCIPLFPEGSSEACYVPMPGARATPPLG
jgi:hypothetical protein